MKKHILTISVAAAMLAVPVFEASAIKAPVAASAAEASAKPANAGKYYVTSDVLNVRSGPGTNYPVIGSLTQGLKVRVISVIGDKGNRWAKIKFEGLTAYVSRRYLAKK